MQVQPIRVTYNQACELLSITRDTLRNLTLKDASFPKPIKYGTNRQAPVFFDYVDLVTWHQKQKSRCFKGE